jgi:hypothetical protein
MAAILSPRTSGGLACAAHRLALAHSAGPWPVEPCSGENWLGSQPPVFVSVCDPALPSSPVVSDPLARLALRSVLMRSFSPPFRRVAAQNCSPGRKPGYKVRNLSQPHHAPPAAPRALSGPPCPFPSPSSASRARNRITAIEWICETRDSPTPRMIPTSFMVSSS